MNVVPFPSPQIEESASVAPWLAAGLDYAAAFAAGPIPRLTKDQQRRQALRGLRHISALDPERGASFMSIHHRIVFPDDHTAIPGKAHTDFKTAVDDAMYWSGEGYDVYWGMGAQEKAGEPSNKWPHRRKAIRQGWNIRACRCLYIDIDVKPGAHNSTKEAVETLARLVQTLGWEPTMIVGSGNGGLHVYWRLDTPVTPKEFAPMAEALKKAVGASGLKTDPGCTSNVCCLLRVPGTWNFKGGPDVDAKPVTLVYMANEQEGDAQ